ncbi:MAG: helix-turn-helix transcriptional regulator [Oscillospiraceae bacterium]|nr:helix-turn-helix transcriptional regulator [Oscillospiraceae bacterium]
MIDNTSKQPENNNLYVWKNFSDGVGKLLHIKGMKQADLIKITKLPKTTIDRICGNNNGRGKKYEPKLKIYRAICVAFGLNREEAKKLYYAAYPAMKHLGDILDKGMSIEQAEIYLSHEQDCDFWE